jgi:hypothetical protein
MFIVVNPETLHKAAQGNIVVMDLHKELFVIILESILHSEKK